MSNFIKSFSPLFKRLKLKKYLLEIILLSIAIFLTIIALIIYVKNGQTTNEINSSEALPSLNTSTDKVDIFVDVSGSVKKPNLYQVNYGARIKDVIDKAGGLSDEADVMFFNRNFNLARVVSDQEKIYIPSAVEINNGIFIQNQRTLDYTSPTTSTVIANNSPTDTDSQIINLNSATIEELDQLPGIGQVTANKIITNRPYTILEELLTKKVVNKGVFEKIKNLISL
ncbi:MAG: helix-hairpin-helix domain-containing protein [Patescibacteria group bacterium]